MSLVNLILLPTKSSPAESGLTHLNDKQTRTKVMQYNVNSAFNILTQHRVETPWIHKGVERSANYLLANWLIYNKHTVQVNIEWVAFAINESHLSTPTHTQMHVHSCMLAAADY